MYRVAQNSTLRLILSFTVCTSLLLLPGVSLLSEASQGQDAVRNARPGPKKPEGILPDLEDVKKESNLEHEAPLPISSTMRAKRNQGKPWDGRRVGDPEALQSPSGPPELDRETRRAHARRRAASPPLYEDQLIQNFFSIALLRSPTADETLYWNYGLRAGYNQNQTSLKLAVIELGKTVFESASYLARNRDAHGYVYDLYKTYLLREPDAGGWAYWEALVPTNGREYVRRGFEESGEFANLLATISLSGAAGTNTSSLITARVDPHNQPGNGILSRDVSWSVSLLSLPGRNGLDLGLALSYSSLVWTPAGPYFYFDEDNGFPSPGFRLGFPTVQRKTFDAQTGKNAYLLLTPAGHRVELRQTTSATVYEAADSSYLQLTETGATLLVRSTDGTQLTLAETNSEYRCTQIKDRNGNYMSVNYNTLGQITNITDTLNRVITFNYDSNANLISITQAWNGQPSHQWVSFGWSTRNMQYSFADAAVIGIKNGTTVPVITQVALNDTSYFTFDYTNALQVSVIKNYFSGIERNVTSFAYETPSGDVPRLLSRSVSAQNWTGVNGMPAQVTTQYSVASDGACVLTAPDGTVYKEYYGTGWQKGLTTLSEVWSAGVRQKWTTIAWTQDNTSVGYAANPRVTEMNVYDASGNRRRTTIDYGQYAPWGLPYMVSEYAGDGQTEIRRTFTDYNLSQAYLDRRIIGLVSAVHLTNVSSFQGKITYEYDDPARLTALPASATQHDSAYNTSFTARGNLTSVSRWDFTDINNASKKLTSYTNYFITGTPASATDPATHTSSVSYIDAFSDSVNRNTFAYPTTMTDADGYSSTVQYNFDFGAKTRTQSPAPGNQAQGTIQNMMYNGLGQLERITTQNNGAYKRFWYGPNYVASYATVNNVADELYAIQVVDGLGRVIGATTNHPGSSGGYSLVSSIYDQMGRLWKQSNPTEINNSWIVSGDDAVGIYYMQQTYDWKDRPVVTTNQDGTTKTASYAGCGCAGGEVTTLTDEGTLDAFGVAKKRQQKIYKDVLGRVVKTEVFNWDGAGPNGTGGTVYSTTVTAYDARDQITSITQYAGVEGSGSSQVTTMSYDGYGRLSARHVPQQDVGKNTTWAYNADDTVQLITDARGATTTFSYNNGRHMPSTITHALAGSPTIVKTFTYDAAANRKTISQTVGGVAQDNATYTYDQLSRMTSETKHINALEGNGATGGNYQINYSYTLSGQLQSITDPFGSVSNLTYDVIGRPSSVSGTYANVNYTYVNNLAYRAWGALKSASYGDSSSETVTYNNRMQPTQYRSTFNGNNWRRYNYTYYNDARLKQLTDLDDIGGQPSQVTFHYMSRVYFYDHAARVSAVTAVPNNNWALPAPFSGSYGYDAFSNLNSRSGVYGINQSQSDAATYTNNRRNGWTQDADGRVTVSTDNSDTAGSSSRTWTYNAAGETINISETASGVTKTNTLSYDGDGKVLQDSISIGGTTNSSYTVYSTILGTVLTRLDATGNKTMGWVPAKGFAKPLQLKDQNNNPAVAWIHKDVTGLQEDGKAYDPFGNLIANVQPPTSGPAPYVPFYGATWGGASWSSFSKANNLSSGCYSAERSNPEVCNEALNEQMGTLGAAFWANLPGTSPDPYAVDRYVLNMNNSINRRANEQSGATPDSYDVFYSDVYTSTITIFAGATLLQTSDSQQNPSAEERALKRALEILQTKTDCSNFISELIGLSADQTQQPFGSPPTPDFRPLAGGRAGLIPSYEPDDALQAYKAALKQGRVAASGVSGNHRDYVTYGTTTNYLTIAWNREFYSLGLDDQALQTMHESLHLFANFSDVAIASAAHIMATRNATSAGTRGTFESVDAASVYINQQIASHCRP